ncbi:gamete egress and sporozoite traversal protein, putative [Plasmodium ovale]|uniref:Gamete egress and sporozoite traversal protein, putative n=1 Tax=Plasmodium ovale TaxID=36330 RepID=A0A1D3TLM0_PLAOA|nr:gamete egress and sporozoite traversal protein, putative [Plasmodium ovale]
MKTFVYYIGLLLALALQLKAIQLNSVSYAPSAHIELGDKVSNKIGVAWKNHLDSFIDVVSTKIVDKIEEDIENDKGSHNMLILLENDAELFDTESYKGQSMAFIQNEFIKKLREKFNNSKFGKNVKTFGSKLKGKLTDLYKKHKHKVKHFLKAMLSTLVIPMAIRFIRKNLKKWKARTLEATNKLDEKAKSVAEPIITAMYDQFRDKLDEYSQKNEAAPGGELSALKDLEEEKEEIDDIEKEEKKLLQE